MGTDAAKSTGLGTMIADQQVKDAYTQGLSALAATGQGRSAMIGNNMEQQARSSARQASTDAAIAAEQASAQGQLVGRLAGYGMFAASQGPNFVKPGVFGSYDNPANGGMGLRGAYQGALPTAGGG
jgi:hypothetical protein